MWCITECVARNVGLKKEAFSFVALFPLNLTYLMKCFPYSLHFFPHALDRDHVLVDRSELANKNLTHCKTHNIMAFIVTDYLFLGERENIYLERTFLYMTGHSSHPFYLKGH